MSAGQSRVIKNERPASEESRVLKFNCVSLGSSEGPIARTNLQPGGV
jgi:hypothetical protein